MDDLETLNRRARLRELIRECFDDKLGALISHIEGRTGKRPNQGELSSLQKDNNPSKSFGDKKAKVLTEQIGLHRRWFDMAGGDNIRPEDWNKDRPMFSNLTERERSDLDNHLSLLPSTNSKGIPDLAESSSLDHGDSDVIKALPRRIIERADYYTINQYAAGGSMGHGIILHDQPGVINSWNVSREWVEKNVRSNTGVANLCIVTGFGDSMRPELNPGDPLIVDTGVKSVVADGIYFFRVGDECYIKQLQKVPTTDGKKFIASSFNPSYKDFEITQGMDFEVLGKVLKVWRGTDF